MPAESPAFRPAVFLDRDGVIIANRDDYVKSIDEVVYLPGALAALARLAVSQYLVVIVTNQSAIGRGILPAETAEAIGLHVIGRIRREGGRIDRMYVCPHTPDDNCDCRKPKPGLLLRAARELPLDLSGSWMVGDALSDAQAALAAGVRPILVRTGRGTEQADLSEANGLNHVPVVADLAEAVGLILAAS